MATTKTKHQFAICVKSEDPDLLTPRMIYEILPDDSAAKSKHVRVIDNEGEDYLYPVDFFMFVDFPLAVKRTLQKVPSRPGSTSSLPRAES